MPIGVLNRVGLLSGSSSPASLVAYLASIGKDSWYARFVAGQGMNANSDGSGSVSDGGVVGCWAPHQSSGFTAKFLQATAASRPTYSASTKDGTPAIYGNATSWHLALDSTSALNGSYSLLLSGLLPVEAATVFSHNVTQFAMTTLTNAAEPIHFTGSQLFGNHLAHSWRKDYKIAHTANRVQFGVTVTGTAHNGNAPNILRRSNNTNYSSATIFEVVLIAASLTAAEIDTAKSYLA